MGLGIDGNGYGVAGVGARVVGPFKPFKPSVIIIIIFVFISFYYYYYYLK